MSRADDDLGRFPSPEEFIRRLGEASLDAWHDAALRAMAATSIGAAFELDRSVATVDPIELWNIFDDLDAEIYRFSGPEAGDVLRTRDELEAIRVASRRAVAALECRNHLTDTTIELLLGPFLAIWAD